MGELAAVAGELDDGLCSAVGRQIILGTGLRELHAKDPGVRTER